MDVAPLLRLKCVVAPLLYALSVEIIFTVLVAFGCWCSLLCVRLIALLTEDEKAAFAPKHGEALKREWP
jgi:hypothetical protein